MMRLWSSRRWGGRWGEPTSHKVKLNESIVYWSSDTYDIYIIYLYNMICAIYIYIVHQECTYSKHKARKIYRIFVSSTQWMLHFERRWPRQHWSWAMPDFWRTVTMENPTKLRHLRVDLLWLLNYMKWLILPWDSGWHLPNVADVISIVLVESSYICT